ncbi:MAG: BrnA antitoxin family protein [Betaproteobacteria bacterium]|nr:BrnA antitoxin family protein [Betaproteobacteria bacterium]
MKDSYDFSSSKRSPIIDPEGKTRVTVWVDDDVLAAFRARAIQEGKGYQALMNDALRSISDNSTVPITVESLRRMLRETIHEELRTH